MGLDITAYSKLEYIETTDMETYEQKYDWNQTVMACHWDAQLPDRAGSIVDNGVYKINGSQYSFRAGSYSGYNEWREQLSLMATGLRPRTIWSNPELHRFVPFFELIHFSDCEGVIGPEVSRKLAADFAKWQDTADQHEDSYFREKYVSWRRAFELASDGGMVVFA